ncbi:MAG TPA: hypothetical protein VM511_10045 [Luteolibacter sp.]|nr:hypothetical protein [Luteolibacter sp.]
MKIIPGILVLVAGIGIGWLAARAPGVAPASAKEESTSKRERPKPSRLSSAPRPPSFKNGSIQQRSDAIRRWTADMTPSNWRQYLEFATSEEAAEHEFLINPSIESIEFLQKLGENGGAEAFMTMRKEKLLPEAAGEVMEGWVKNSPEEAFTYFKTNKLDKGYPTMFSKVAAAMFETDPEKALEGMQEITGPFAREVVRRKGFAEADAFFKARWTTPSKGPDHDSNLANLAIDWEMRGLKNHLYLHPGLDGGIVPTEQEKEFETSRRKALLEMDLNPVVREALEKLKTDS